MHKKPKELKDKPDEQTGETGEKRSNIEQIVYEISKCFKSQNDVLTQLYYVQNYPLMAPPTNPNLLLRMRGKNLDTRPKNGAI